MLSTQSDPGLTSCAVLEPAVISPKVIAQVANLSRVKCVLALSRLVGRLCKSSRCHLTRLSVDDKENRHGAETQRVESPEN